MAGPYYASRSDGEGGVVCGCLPCPDVEGLDIVFSGVADPCPAICTHDVFPALPSGQWFINTSFPINGGHSLPRIAASDWKLEIPIPACSFDQYGTGEECGDFSGEFFGNLQIEVICNETPNSEGKHLGLVVASTFSGSIMVLYDLFSDSSNWFNFGDIVAFPGCGGTFTVSHA